MNCPQCGFENPEGAKFCNQCATQLVVAKDTRLELVQSTLPETMKDKILSTKIGGERKNVTVLFADVSGFTKLSEKLDPEEITDIINKLFKVLIKIVYEYEGTIDKLIGDCIMALFGAPIAHEDDPERAAHAALDILYAMDRFNEKQGTNLSIHMGINSGLVIVGGVGSDLKMDYTVMGDTVNLAERLMETAKDEILASESVYKKASYLFEMSALKPVALKGKAKNVTPYRIIAKKETPKSKRGIPGLVSPLVGRNNEFKTLKSAVDMLPKGYAIAISVIGETGLGKSRLIHELKEYAEGKVIWLSGRAFSYGKHFPFRIFQEQIRSYLSISEFDAKSNAGEKLQQKAQVLFKEKYDEYFPYLCLFLSLKVPEQLQDKTKYLDPKQLKLQTAVAVKALFKHIAEEKPLLLNFEDMHLIDEESQQLVTFLLDGLKDTPVLFLFETRPEEETGIYRIKDSVQNLYKKRYLEIRLEPLKQKDAKELVENLLQIPDFPAHISSLILEKSEGNPFYIEEIIGTFIDAGIVQTKEDRLHVVSDISTFEIPDTVEAVVQARIDRLPLEAKELLGKASVIGRIFPYKVLSRIDGEANMQSLITILENRQFIMKLHPPSEDLQDTKFTFKHILTRDICYKGLLKKKRRNIHKKVAQCMELIYKEKIEDYFEILAFHYYNAENLETAFYYYEKSGDIEKESYRNDAAIDSYSYAIIIHEGLFPEGEEEKRAHLLIKRGDVRELQADYDNALKDYEMALDHYTEIKKKAEVKSKIGSIYYNKSEYETAISHYRQAVELLRKGVASPLLSEILIDYAQLLSVGKSDHEAAEKTVEQAFQIIDKKKEPSIYAHGLNILGSLYYRTGDYDKSLEYRQKALSLWKALNDKRGIANGYTNVGAVYYRKGQLDKALEFYQQSLEITEEIGYKRGIAQACRNIGLVYKVKGVKDSALEYYNRCLSISEEIGNKVGIAAVFFNMGHIYLSGELDTALAYYKKSLELSKQIGNKGPIGQVSNNIGIVYRYKGELNRALKYYKHYLIIAEEIGDKWGIGAATGNIGFVYYDKGDLKKAMEYGKKSLNLFEKIGYKGGIGLASQIIGNVHLDIGNIEEAMKYFKKHLSIYEEMGIKTEIRRAYLSLGNLHTEMQQFDKAKVFLEKALIIAEEAGGKIDISETYITLAELHTGMKQYVSAIDFAEKAFFLAKDTGAKSNEILALRAIGMALTSENPEKAQFYLEEATDIALKQNMKLTYAKSLLELARILKKSMQSKEAVEYLEKAEKIFIQAGAERWVEKAQSLLKEPATDNKE